METVAAFYGGEYFRSELEARWAVFFDALRLRWRYDRGGFSAKAGRWLSPAFWLPELDRWVIVRPWPNGIPRQNPPYESILWQKDGASGLSARQLRRLIVLYGPPVVASSASEEFAPEVQSTAAAATGACRYAGADKCGGVYAWAECPKCGRIALVPEGDAALACNCFPRSALVYTVRPKRLRIASTRAAEADIRPRRMSQGLLTPEFRRHCMPN